MSTIFFGEAPNGLRGYSAIAIVTVGLFLASTEFDMYKSILQYKTGKIIILGAMLCWALDNNLSRRLLKNSSIEPSKIAMLKFVIGAVILSMLLLVPQPVNTTIDSLTSIDRSEWITIYILAVFGFAGALIFLLEGLKKIGTIKSMLTLAFTPIVGTIIAMAARGDSINSFEAIATGMIAIGTYIISKS